MIPNVASPSNQSFSGTYSNPPRLEDSEMENTPPLSLPDPQKIVV